MSVLDIIQYISIIVLGIFQYKYAKGSRKNNFAELALGFGSDLADPREQNHRNSELFRGFCE